MFRRIAITCGFLIAASCSASGGSASFSDGLGGAPGAGAAAGVGANGAGGGGVIFGGGAAAGNSGLQMRLTPDCVADVRQGEKVPLDLFIMFDQSLSMTCPTASGSSRWDAVKAALISFLQDPAADGMSAGIQYFGLGSGIIASDCTVSLYATPDVEIAPLPGNAQALINSLNAHGPATDTPTSVALQGAIQHASQWKSQHQGDTVAVVLVTDGVPNSLNNCGGMPETLAAAQAGVQQGIPTYVIGIVAGSTPCDPIRDKNPPSQADLDSIATAGGTQHGFLVDTSQNTEQQFVAEMNAIRGNAQIPCQFQIPPPPMGQTFDSTKVNIEFSDSSGNPTIVYAVPNSSACDPSKGGGWFFDDPSAPTVINLCPTTCSTVTTTVGIQVKVALGCDSIKPPS